LKTAKLDGQILDFSLNQFVEDHVVPGLEKLPEAIKKLYLFYFSIELLFIGLLIGA
jgi:hypothetical protein